jgi:hypothetical protein
MAYLPKYDHDIFVSYAHIDNEPESKGSEGWVDSLVRLLGSEIRKRLGTREPSIWMDRELAGNRPITKEILTRVERSGLLLLVMSPSYLNSEWCRRERDAFLSLVKDRIGEGSVFIVHARRVPREEIPAELAELRGDQFWVEDADSGTDRPLGVPDPAESLYIKRIYGLSQEIKNQLTRLRTIPAFSPPRVTAPAPGLAPLPPIGKGLIGATKLPGDAKPVSVFVARSTDDLEESESDLRTYLTQAGVEVLPRSLYPIASAEAYEQAMRADLERCKLAVELLGPSRGHELPGGSRQPALQHEIAIKMDKPLLSWRDRALDIATVTDAAHRRLLEGARACGIEEFKRAVIDEARREAPKRRPPPTRAMVFVNADANDRLLAQQVGRALQSWGIECYWPLEAGSPEVVRQDFEENLRQCDGVVLVYGVTGAEWVRSQLRLGRKILALRDRPLNALAIVEGPPPEKKAEIGAAIPNLLTLDCRTGIDNTLLQSFVETLQVAS